MGELPGTSIIPVPAPEATPSGVLEFSPKARAALENVNFPVYTLTGSSIRDIGERKPISVIVHDENPIYSIRNTATQVAINPNRTLVLPWRRSILDEPESFDRDRRFRFATLLPRPGDAKDMQFVLGNPAAYAELAALGDPVIEHVLFGEYGHANVMTNHVTVGERRIKGDTAGGLSWLGPVEDSVLPPLVASVGLDQGKLVIADIRADFEGVDITSPDRNATVLRVVPLIFPAGYQSGKAAEAA